MAWVRGYHEITVQVIGIILASLVSQTVGINN